MSDPITEAMNAFRQQAFQSGDVQFIPSMWMPPTLPFDYPARLEAIRAALAMQPRNAEMLVTSAKTIHEFLTNPGEGSRQARGASDS